MDHRGTLVGKRVAVYFIRELAFYTGKVVAFRKDAAQHWINYDDGENEWLGLGMEHFFILDTKDTKDNDDNDDNIASGGSKKKKKMVAINANANPAGVVFREVGEASVPRSYVLDGVDVDNSSEDKECEGWEEQTKTDDSKKKKKDKDKEQKKEGYNRGGGGITAAEKGRGKINIKPDTGNGIQKNNKKNKIVPAKKKAIVTPNNNRKG